MDVRQIDELTAVYSGRPDGDQLDSIRHTWQSIRHEERRQDGRDASEEHPGVAAGHCHNLTAAYSLKGVPDRPGDPWPRSGAPARVQDLDVWIAEDNEQVALAGDLEFAAHGEVGVQVKAINHLGDEVMKVFRVE